MAIFGISARPRTIKPAPFLFVVDGDHRYDGVVSDLWNILTSYPEARYGVFHDFSLRYDRANHRDVRVDRALLDTLAMTFRSTRSASWPIQAAAFT